MTLHRVVTNLVDANLAVERDGDVVLTPPGAEVADAVLDYADRVGTAERVAPLLNSVELAELPVPVSAGLFAEADVLRPAPSQPQRPVQRVLSAVRVTECAGAASARRAPGRWRASRRWRNQTGPQPAPRTRW